MHRIIVFTHAAVIAMALLLGFLALFTLHETLTTTNHGDYYVSLEQTDGTATPGDVVAAAEDLIQQHQMTVAVSEPDPHDLDGAWNYYAVSSDPSNPMHTWLEDGYPNFSTQPHIEVYPLTEWTTNDLRLNFGGFATRDEAELFLNAVEPLGLRGGVGTAPEPATWTEMLFNYNTGLTVAVTVICIIATAGAGVLLNARAYAVKRLAGHSYLRILGSDMAQIGRWWVVLFPAVAACYVAFLFFYNGFAQVDLLAGITAQILLTLSALAIAVHAAALSLLYRTGLSDALKGRLPTRRVAGTVYAVRLVAVIIAVMAATATVTGLQRVNDYASGAEEMEQAEQVSRLYIGGVRDYEEQSEADRSIIGPWLKDADTQEQTVLAHQDYPDNFLPSGQRSADTMVLVVNDTYLEQENVLDDIDTPDNNGVRLFIPQSRMPMSGNLGEGTDKWISFHGDNLPTDDIGIFPYPDGRTFFTYGTVDPVTSSQRPVVEDPIVVALPNGYLDAEWYAMEARGGNLMFLTGATAEQQVAEQDLAFYVTGVEPVTTTLANTNRFYTAQLRISTVNLVVVTTVLIMTSVASCLVYTRARSQHIFARYINGWTFGATHRLMLIVEAMLAAALIGWAAGDMIALVRAFDDIVNGVFIEDIVRARLTLVISCAIGTAVVIIVSAVLARFHRKIVREGASQA
ncbi:hypothetical protein Q8791_17295 [Nocardiopsis sp. CT-R113]|uniref:Uncharacterized protein n=1 Tax=Nocardiopsis codii TaxID=3065942 RepID=A0ABU7K9Q3_9ACTN|nr:hypothetical protein [Nocardiopsis sp. CT-R113]MEE2038974.1 hypothetical protein [Nocardiopsis sp. CT-R113]